MEKQNETILHYLKKHKKGITSWDAIQLYGITRLSARIYDLTEKGYEIKSIREPNKNNNGTHARYFLTRAVADNNTLL